MMEKTCLQMAEEYYRLIGEKNIEGIKKYLSSGVEFYSPFAKLRGKEEVVAATRSFMEAFKKLTIRDKFATANQAMIVYQVDMPGIATDFPSASLLNFHNGQIVKIELFYDGSPFKNLT